MFAQKGRRKSGIWKKRKKGSAMSHGGVKDEKKPHQENKKEAATREGLGLSEELEGQCSRNAGDDT